MESETMNSLGPLTVIGRSRQLTTLSNRYTTDGLTVLAGRPLIGKTTLVRATVDALDPSMYLVGWAESTGEFADLFARAIEGLYEQWLSDASYRQQAAMLWRRRSTKVPEAVAEVIGTFLDTVSSTPIHALSSPIRKLFASLEGLDKKLQKGITLPRLSFQDATSLLDIVGDLTKRRLLLVLDNFERSPQLDLEISTLASLVHRRPGPGAHVVVLTRDDDNIVRSLRSVARESPLAILTSVGAMELSETEAESLVSEIKRAIPAVDAVSAEKILNLIDGYPAVLHWWLNPLSTRRIESVDEFVEAARDAHLNRYRDLEKGLLELEGTSRSVAMRLALMPPLYEGVAHELVDVILPARLSADVVELRARGVLETVLGFGHNTRHDAAGRFMLEDQRLRHCMVTELELLVGDIAQAITVRNSEGRDYILLSLVLLEAWTKHLEVSRDVAFACRFAREMLLLEPTRRTLEEFLSVAPDLPPSRIIPVLQWAATGLLDVAYIAHRPIEQESLLRAIRMWSMDPTDERGRHFLATAWSNALNYELAFGNGAGRARALDALRDLAQERRAENGPIERLVIALSQAIAWDFGDEIGSPSMLHVAALWGEKELTDLERRAKGGKEHRNETEALRLSEELRAIAEPLIDNHTIRHYFLKTVVRCIKFGTTPNLMAEADLLERTHKTYLGPCLKCRASWAEGIYWCLMHGLFKGRIEERDTWAELLYRATAQDDAERETGRWLYLGLIDSAEFSFMITQDLESARPFYAKIDQLNHERPIFRQISLANAVGRIFWDKGQGVKANVEYGFEKNLLIVLSYFNNFPDDPTVHLLIIGALSSLLKWCAVPAHSEDARIVARLLKGKESLFIEAMDGIAAAEGSRTRRLIESRFKKLHLLPSEQQSTPGRETGDQIPQS